MQLGHDRDRLDSMENADDTKFFAAPAAAKVLCKTVTPDGTFFFANPGVTSMTKNAPLAKSRPAAAELPKTYLSVNNQTLEQGTNINSVVVPDALRVKVKTGLEWFDHAADHDNPGFTPSMVVLFTAGPGCGKSTLCRQLADAATGEGHISLYNAGEESIFQVKLTCERLNLGDGFIISCDPRIDTVLDHGRALMKKQPGKQLIVFIDSLATMDDGFYKDGSINSMTAVRVMKKIVEFCKETLAIAIVIGHVNKAGKFAGRNQMKHDIDASAHMSFVPNSNNRKFKFTKNRFASVPVKGTVLAMSKTGLEMVEDDVNVELDDADESE